MTSKPERWKAEFAESFTDRTVVEAYRHRSPYPDGVFETLERLLVGEPRAVLDVGCGTGDLARRMVGLAARVDAVDASEAMIEMGKTLPNGDSPRLRWVHARAEGAPLQPPYALITAGRSLHWMDWDVVLPRFSHLLTPHGYLAVVTSKTEPMPWDDELRQLTSRYSTTGGWPRLDMISILTERGLFEKRGETSTPPEPWAQTVDDFVEQAHSRSGLSRERMKPEDVAAFDAAVRRLVTPHARDGVLHLRVVGHVVWGRPLDPR
jgi:ubiquinone/menaquinone biosynthesis C-methylase UbiE